MPFHLILLILSLVLLGLAGFLCWPRTNSLASYGHALGWFGLAAYVLAGLVP